MRTTLCAGLILGLVCSSASAAGLVCAGADAASTACAKACSNTCVNDDVSVGSNSATSGCFNTGDGFENTGAFNIGSGNTGDCNLASGGTGGNVGAGCPEPTWDLMWRACLVNPAAPICQNPPASYGPGALKRIRNAVAHCV